MEDAGSGSTWMPDLCRPYTLFGILVAVELVVLAAVLLRPPAQQAIWLHLSTASLLALWLALTCVTVLCGLRARILRLPGGIGIGVALLLPPVIVAAATWVVARLDQELDLGFTIAPAQTLQFVLSCTLVALLLTGALLRHAYVGAQWRAQLAATSQARVEALQARIRPHFLFNSMNTIASLIRHDPAAAEHAVEDLSELFRAALGGDASESTLGEELHLTRRYLAIESLRLGPRLVVEWALADDLPLELALPRLVLQPLAENAITHGIARLPRGGTLNLAVQRQGHELIIEIRNPLPPAGSDVHGNQHAQDSIARRLEHRFGARARLVAGARDGYYAAALHVPIQTA